MGIVRTEFIAFAERAFRKGQESGQTKSASRAGAGAARGSALARKKKVAGGGGRGSARRPGGASTIRTSPLGVPGLSAPSGKNILGG